MLIVALALGGFESPRVNPMFGPPGSTLLTLGAKSLPKIQIGKRIDFSR
jgi:hypothetical protein